MLSALSREFLDPIYEHLLNKFAIIEFCPSRCGGNRYSFLLKSKEELDSLIVQEFKPQAKVIFYPDVEVVWDGIITVDVFKLYWDNPHVELFRMDKPDNYLYYFEMSDVIENKDKNCILIKEPKSSDYYAYVPMNDGTVKPGSY